MLQQHVASTLAFYLDPCHGLDMHNDGVTPNLIGSAKVCELLGIDRSTLTRWIQSGRIKAAMKMPGPKGAYLFDPAAVDAAKPSTTP